MDIFTHITLWKYLFKGCVYIHLHLHHKQVRWTNELFHDIYTRKDKTEVVSLALYKSQRPWWIWKLFKVFFIKRKHGIKKLHQSFCPRQRILDKNNLFECKDTYNSDCRLQKVFSCTAEETKSLLCWLIKVKQSPNKISFSMLW